MKQVAATRQQCWSRAGDYVIGRKFDSVPGNSARKEEELQRLFIMGQLWSSEVYWYKNGRTYLWNKFQVDMVIIEAVMNILVGIEEYNVHKGCAVID